jgi:hypothetical protein
MAPQGGERSRSFVGCHHGHELALIGYVQRVDTEQLARCPYCRPDRENLKGASSRSAV